MWHDPPFSKRNKATKEQWGWRLEAKGVGGEGWK